MSLPMLHFARLPWPADWQDIFGREAPMIVELGFGGGDNLLTLAKENPAANVLGVKSLFLPCDAGPVKSQTQSFRMLV